MPQTRSNSEGRVTIRQTSPKKDYAREDFFRDPKNDKSNSQWNRFEDFVKKIAAVPKEEVDELRAEHKRERKERNSSQSG